MFYYGVNYVFLWMNYVFLWMNYGRSAEHVWFSPPGTAPARTSDLSADVNQNLVQIKTEGSRGIGSREPIPGSPSIFYRHVPLRNAPIVPTALNHHSAFEPTEPRTRPNTDRTRPTTEPTRPTPAPDPTIHGPYPTIPSLTRPTGALPDQPRAGPAPRTGPDHPRTLPDHPFPERRPGPDPTKHGPCPTKHGLGTQN